MKSTSDSSSLRAMVLRHPTGLTLIEILIALTMTLIVLVAMAQAFKYASGEIASGRAVLELSNRMRNAQQLLRSDLAGLTVDVRPHTENPPNGYFEYIDDVDTDKSALLVDQADGYLGDTDDVLAFTARNVDNDYRGRFNGNAILSPFAEIIWYTEAADLNGDGVLDRNGNGIVDYTESIALYRRVLLIRPDLNDSSTLLPLSTGEETTGNILNDVALQTAVDFFSKNDVSARWVDSNDDGARDLIVANTLQDLARREFRYGRDSVVFPHAFDRTGVALSKSAIEITNAAGVVETIPSGDDILLTDVAAFDVQIYSPNAGVDLVDLDSNGVEETFVEASDVGYVGLNNVSTATQQYGGFVDLGSNPDLNGDNSFDRVLPFFTSAPTVASGLSNTFCTWSPHYETDGLDQDLDGNIDEGTNGLDDDNINGVDDINEKETLPPYPYPVRGIQVTFRMIEKNTKQVRQTSVVQSFLPQ